MAVQKQDDQHEHTFSSYVRIRDVVLKTYLGWWTIGGSGERGSGISVLPARHDDDDDDFFFDSLVPYLLYPSNSDNWLVTNEITKVWHIYCSGCWWWWGSWIHNNLSLFFGRCPWCNGYCHRKWTQRHKFKSWMRLIWTCVAVSISYDDNHYTTGTSQKILISYCEFKIPTTISILNSRYVRL